MESLKYATIIAVVVSGLIIGLLLATAGPAYPAPQAQSYCLDEYETPTPRRLGDQACRPNPLDGWQDSREHLVPAHPEARDA